MYRSNPFYEMQGDDLLSLFLMLQLFIVGKRFYNLMQLRVAVVFVSNLIELNTRIHHRITFSGQVNVHISECRISKINAYAHQDRFNTNVGPQVY